MSQRVAHAQSRDSDKLHGVGCRHSTHDGYNNKASRVKPCCCIDGPSEPFDNTGGAGRDRQNAS